MLYSESNPIKVVVVDDHEIFRFGVRKLLSTIRIVDVVGEGANGVEAIELAEKYKPDVFFLDIFMPKMTGIEAIPEIRKISPESYIIMLTAFEDFLHIEKALTAGADGYLTKGVSPQILQEAVTKVVEGERVFSKSIVKLLSDRRMTYDETNDHNVSITKREEEILKLIAQGLTNNEISERLNLSVRTIESHRYNLIKKLNLKSASQLVKFAVMNSSYIK